MTSEASVNKKHIRPKCEQNRQTHLCKDCGVTVCVNTDDRSIIARIAEIGLEYILLN